MTELPVKSGNLMTMQIGAIAVIFSFSQSKMLSFARYLCVGYINFPGSEID